MLDIIFSIMLMASVIALLVWIVYAAKHKKITDSADQRLIMRGRKVISRQQQLVIFRYNHHEYLIGLSPQTIVLIDKIPASEFDKVLP